MKGMSWYTARGEDQCLNGDRLVYLSINAARSGFLGSLTPAGKDDSWRNLVSGISDITR